MAQINWTYYSLTGLPYDIEMYHGDDSGHIILMVNEEITMIDFNKKHNHKYSFYIENQLLELDISEHNSTFEYVLTPQPMKLEGHDEEKYFDETFWIPLIILIIAINLVILIINYNVLE